MATYDPQKLLEITRLLEASRDVRYDDPQRMVYLAELALAAAEALHEQEHGVQLVASVRARVWAELANAYRVADYLDMAERAIEKALDYYEASSQEPKVLGLIAERLSGLLCHRRRFSEAFLLLDRLYGFYDSIGETHLAGRVLIERGLYTENAGDAHTAVLITKKGLDLLDTSADPRLLLAGVHNLMWCLTELGEYQMVKANLERIRPLYGADRLNLLRLRWVEARTAAGIGRSDTAERLYEETRAGFLAAKLVFPAALVSLELALLWQSQKRWDEVRALAEELVLAFQGLKVAREAILALVVLTRAVERKEVTPDEVRERILAAAAVVRSLAAQAS